MVLPPAREIAGGSTDANDATVIFLAAAIERSYKMRSLASFYQSTFVLAAFAAAGFAQGEVLSLDEIKARNGVLLSAEELQKVVPGAKVINHAPNGDTLVWTNNLDGTLVASTDARGGSNMGGQRLRSAEGSWRIQNGAYCVEMRLPRMEKHWCRHLYRIGDKYYGVPAHRESNGGVMEFDFRK
jgi:hypothetical protein